MTASAFGARRHALVVVASGAEWHHCREPKAKGQPLGWPDATHSEDASVRAT